MRTVRFNSVIVVAAATAILWVFGPLREQIAGQAPQQAPPARGVKAGEFFKNVTTSTLKELSPSDFVGAMRVMAAALGYDCADCHPDAGTDTVNWTSDAIPQKVTARRMVEMVATINRQNFGGVQRVTCWTCHHGLDRPT